MKEKLSLSIILPIKSSKSKDFNEYFEKAITSIKSQSVDVEELIIVHTVEESLISFLNEYDFETLNVVKLLWDKEPSYSEQINFGIKNAKGTWVSLFEFDDEIYEGWLGEWDGGRYVCGVLMVSKHFYNCLYILCYNINIDKGGKIDIHIMNPISSNPLIYEKQKYYFRTNNR